jgi:hypothetical protein
VSWVGAGWPGERWTWTWTSSESGATGSWEQSRGDPAILLRLLPITRWRSLIPRYIGLSVFRPACNSVVCSLEMWVLVKLWV